MAENNLEKRDRAFLYKTHPTLFRFIVVKVLWNLLIASILFFGWERFIIPPSALNEPPTIPLEFWGSLFLSIACMQIWGLLGDLTRYHWIRKGLLISTYVGGFWAFGFLSLFLRDEIALGNAPWLWTVYTINNIFLASEPALNPLAQLANNRQGRNNVERI